MSEQGSNHETPDAAFRRRAAHRPGHGKFLIEWKRALPASWGSWLDDWTVFRRYKTAKARATAFAVLERNHNYFLFRIVDEVKPSSNSPTTP